MRSDLRRVIGLLLFTLVTGSLSAQNAISPYSIFGIGERESGRFAHQIGMGGLSAGVRDPLQLNVLQPASYSNLKYTTIEIGGFYQESLLSDASQTASTSTGGFNYLAFGFPLMDGWGMAFGVSPYSKVGYDILTRSSYPFSDATVQYQGDGGFDRFYIGQAIEVLPGLSLGINGSYYFGSMARTTTAFFDSDGFYNTTQEESVGATGFSFDAGLQYNMYFGADSARELIIGASYANPTTMSGELNDLFYTFTEGQGGNRNYRDTVYNIEGREVDVIFNSNYNLGFTYGGRHPQLVQYAWSFGADYQILNRNELNSSSEVRGTYNNGFRATIGGQMIPYFAFDMDRGSYLTQMDYRFGAYYEDIGLVVNGESLTDAGLTLGFGFPLGRRTQTTGDVKLAMLNVGMIFGRRGSNNSGNIEENYARFVVGLTLNDKWFTQFKYR